MKISKCRWPNNADSPVMLMVDDFANAWVDINNNKKMDKGESWGYSKDYHLSPVFFLKEEILKNYPYVKTTFFIPVNRVAETTDYKMCAHFASINETPEVAEFFRSTFHTPSFEAAYHGTTHGISGNRNTAFVHEWETFPSVEEAVKRTAVGRELFKEVFGHYPQGGKYCGYKINQFSDDSIDQSAFLWWCRHWTPPVIHEGEGGYENDKCNLSYFGSNRVIDMPSTVIGSLFSFNEENSVKKTIKKWLGRKSFTRDEILNRGYDCLEHLLSRRQIISIQEHISPARTDKKRQVPNIFDDSKSLGLILEFLKSRNCWYGTATEIASYFEMYNRSEISPGEQLEFKIKYTGRSLKDSFLSVFIECDQEIKSLLLPDGKRLNIENCQRVGNTILIKYLPVMNGKYRLERKEEYAYSR